MNTTNELPCNDERLYFYRKNDYENASKAFEDGALYSTPSCISLYESSGAHDLHEIMDALSQCAGGVKFSAAIYVDEVLTDLVLD